MTAMPKVHEKKVKLPSGAELRIQLSSFGTGRAMYQAVCEELKSLKLDPEAEVDVNLKKDLFLAMMTSKKVESCVWACFEKCLYNESRISEETFEPIEARDDYITLCYEVAKENIAPFWKSLYAEYGVHFTEAFKQTPQA